MLNRPVDLFNQDWSMAKNRTLREVIDTGLKSIAQIKGLVPGRGVPYCWPTFTTSGLNKGPITADLILPTRYSGRLRRPGNT